MEAGYELDSVSELPLIPMEYSGDCSFISCFNSLESVVPFPSSDFSPTVFDYDHFQLQPGSESFFQDSPLSLLNLQYSEPTRFDEFFYPDASTSFLHMPDLLSVEQTTTGPTTSFSCLPPPPPPLPLAPQGPGEKRCCLVPDVPAKFDSFGKSSFNMSSSSNSGSAAASHVTTARARRQKIAEKTRSLEKLMPWEKKMDMATLLEEAYKYIKFLQAQTAALRWMPLESAYYSVGGDIGGRRGGGDAGLLRMLNRQQILQVLSNSPAAQTVLYKRRWCVFSHEQLLSLKMMAQTPRNL